MWPWIKRWRDWAMNDLWPLHRIGASSPVLHCGYEKAGVVLRDQPIPWSAEAVVVECLLRLPPGVPRRKADFFLRLPAQDPLPADCVRDGDTDELCRLVYRLPPPTQSVAADLIWRSHVLGKVTLPMLSRDEFLKHVSLRMPSLSVCLANQTVACQTFVATQGRGLIASAVLRSATPLAPITDLGLRVEFRAEPSGVTHTVPVTLSQSQLRGKEAPILVSWQRLPRRSANWTVSWLLGERVLATQRIRSISASKFLRSLRLADTRFVLQPSRGKIQLARQLPALTGIRRVGPCFLVTSTEPGIAGVCKLQVRGQVNGAMHPPLLAEQEVLITDGPTPFAPGTEEVASLSQLGGFELWAKSRALGHLPLTPAPTANFTSEGGFKPIRDFAWSLAAEDQLYERLAKLLGE
jgi:hypothetical protein